MKEMLSQDHMKTEANSHAVTNGTPYPVEYKLHILLDGFRRRVTIVELCRHENLPRSLYYQWRGQFMQGVRRRFSSSRSSKSAERRLARLKIAHKLLKQVLDLLKDSGCEMSSIIERVNKIEQAVWMLQVLQKGYSFSDDNKLDRIAEADSLLERAAFGTHRERIRAFSILARFRGISSRTIAKFLNISKSSVNRYWQHYDVVSSLDAMVSESTRKLKADKEANITAVFTILHSPPSEFGINRTSWKIDDLQTCLEERGIPLSRHTIRRIIRNAGYSWRKAKVVLTSNDPHYRQKLNRIKKILSSLSGNERFFSIDEFGPFAIKMKAGRRLVAPNEYPSVPQFQRSKGCLILTAALELSANQVTHFYSKGKNTDEMIRLLDTLLTSCQGCKRIYLSWDAASWHVSSKLKEKVANVNCLSYRRKHETPRVMLAPLPASSQFLNVIESVFSGMARAIIHNSNYSSVDEAKEAIDRYFRERNQYFLDHPKVAGNKIWGNEPTPSRFSETHNCKDKRFR